jgi:hypothetical protein
LIVFITLQIVAYSFVFSLSRNSIKNVKQLALALARNEWLCDLKYDIIFTFTDAHVILIIGWHTTTFMTCRLLALAWLRTRLC